MKTKLQKLVFPEWITYDRQQNEFRTFRVNTIFSLIADVARVSEAKKIGQPDKIDRSSRLVAQKGVISNNLGRDLIDLICY
jgi:hypothetical protein